MSPGRIYRLFVSAKTTVVLLCLLSVLLLLNVALPQAAALGEEEFEALVAASGPMTRFLLIDLRLGRMPTSPVFVSVLVLFFLNLLLVLLARIGPTFRRVTLRPRSEKGLDAWARLEESLEGTPGADWSASHVARTLRGYGYQVRKAGERTFWGVKHRTAPLGFLLFHLSFFLICGGGVLLYYTRFVGFVVLSEGQPFDGAYTSVDRMPPLGGPPELRFTLERADPRFERGDPVHLGASFRLEQAGSSVERQARVNHPAEWGTVRLLVNEAGLAPVSYRRAREAARRRKSLWVKAGIRCSCTRWKPGSRSPLVRIFRMRRSRSRLPSKAEFYSRGRCGRAAPPRWRPIDSSSKSCATG
jgi:cytochrome c biogenesis protein ResB